MKNEQYLWHNDVANVRMSQIRIYVVTWSFIYTSGRNFNFYLSHLCEQGQLPISILEVIHYLESLWICGLSKGPEVRYENYGAAEHLRSAVSNVRRSSPVNIAGITTAGN